MKSLNDKTIFSFLESKKALVACVVAAGLLTLIWSSGHSKNEEASLDPTADTYIPAGYVLVPIEVQNYEALDSILGPYGVVDLFLPSPQGKRGVRVASRVRILRAPQNPSQFAVLVRDSESERLVRNESAFFVVVQNSKQTGTGFVNSEPAPREKMKSRVISEAE